MSVPVTLSEMGMALVPVSQESGRGLCQWPLCHTQQSGCGHCVSLSEVGVI